MNNSKLMIARKLSEIQTKLNAPKNQFNAFGKYKYRNCEDILEALKPLLSDVSGAGSSCYVTLSDDIHVVGDRIYVKVTATISDGEQSISVTAFAREALNKKGMDESQVTGAASSYARKYALNGLFLIDDNKDADSQNNSANAQNNIDPVIADIIDMVNNKRLKDVHEKWNDVIVPNWEKIPPGFANQLNKMISKPEGNNK